MTFNDFLVNLPAILPLVVLIAWTTLLILVDLFNSEERKVVTVLLAALGLVVTIGFALAQLGQEYVAFDGMIVVDGFATYLNVLFLGSGLVGIALAYDYNRRMGIDRSEYYYLMMYSISGMMLMAIAADLIVVFLALELLSIPLYIFRGSGTEILLAGCFCGWLLRVWCGLDLRRHQHNLTGGYCGSDQCGLGGYVLAGYRGGLSLNWSGL
jgi:NADH-quinone oxidoreductase subunit N